MDAIAFIPVRGGSKSIPKKNIKLLNGKPLLYWTTKAAEDCPWISEIIIATDDSDIKQTALSFNFKKVSMYDRNSLNASDTASTESVMLEFLENHPGEINPNRPFVLIQATNPFVQEFQLSEALTRFAEKPEGSLLSCTSFKRFLWNSDGEALNYSFLQRPRRQDFNGSYLENGAFYINTVSNIIKNQNRLSNPVQIYEMPEYSSFEIDEPEDWIIVEQLHQRMLQNQKVKP